MRLVFIAALLLAYCLPANAEDLTPSQLFNLRSKSVVMVTAVETVPRGFFNCTRDLLNPFPLYKIPGRVISFVAYPLIVVIDGPMKAGGSGVIVGADGCFVTNNHVIEDANVFWATMTDGSLIRADVIGSDEDEDLAVLKMRLPKGKSVEPAPLAEYSQIQRGDSVYAIGSPLRLQNTITSGIVSAKSRRMTGPFQDYIQTDLTIGAGSSGGPLFNGKGEVIGITSAMLAVVEETGGMTFSIPVDVVKEDVTQLSKDTKMRFTHVTRGYIGTELKDVTPRIVDELKLKTKSRSGAVIYDLDTFGGAPAEKAGLKKGDIIIKYNGVDIADARSLARLVLSTKPTTKVPVVYIRGEKTLTVTVEVQER